MSRPLGATLVRAVPPDVPGEPGDAEGCLYDIATAGTFPRKNVRLVVPEGRAIIIDSEGLFPSKYAKDGRKLLAEIGDVIPLGKVTLFVIEPLPKTRMILNAKFPEWKLSEDRNAHWRVV